jgi:hypothetical protein
VFGERLIRVKFPLRDPTFNVWLAENMRVIIVVLSLLTFNMLGSRWGTHLIWRSIPPE